MHSEGLAGKTEIFLRYGVDERLEVGMGYLKKQEIVRPLISYVLSPEKRGRPSLATGAMVDSLEDGRQMVFLTAGKSFPTKLGVPVNVYAGIAQVTTRSETRFIGGVVAPLAKGLNASVQFDGRYANVALIAHVGTVSGARVYLGIAAARGDRFGPLFAASLPTKR
ncbi:MAG: hypothetical protein ACR2HJ_13425 [Fimbriimonadales bacterium]